MGRQGKRGSPPRSHKEQKAGAHPEKGTGALGGFMPHPTGDVIKQAFGGDRPKKEKGQ